MTHKFAFIAALLLVLASCGGSSQKGTLRSGDRADFGDHTVQWKVISGMQSGVPSGHKALFFTFTGNNANPNGVTDQDWQRTADRFNSSVYDMKVVMGDDSSVYRDKDGLLSSCSINAIKKGLCKNAPPLSLNKRVELAQSLLARSELCRWIGFDRQFHALNAHRLGAEDMTLHVVAACP